MFAQNLIVALAGASILSQVAAQAEVVFDCSVTPGVCTNMCFGAYCRGYDVALNYDKPSDSKKTDRRNKAGCTKNNRCNGGNSPDPDGPSCDEYPFASTSNADDVQAVNRCVPVAEQNSMALAHENKALLIASVSTRSGRHPLKLLPKQSQQRAWRVHRRLRQPRRQCRAILRVPDRMQQRRKRILRGRPLP